MRIVISTGGTGGHIYPAIAVAEELKAMSHTILFIGGTYGPEKEIATAKGFEFVGLDVRGLDRRSIAKSIRSIMLLPGAIYKAMGIFGTFAPHAVVGAGGYASAPAAIVSAWKKVPLFLMEQNVYPGFVTREFARAAEKVYLSFKRSAKWLEGSVTATFGNPVRRGFRKGAAIRDFSGARKTLLITGGSQGSASINRAVVEALPELKKLPLDIYHHTGKRDFEYVRSSYAEHIPSATVRPYFENMDDLMSKAHLALCRAGASTCAELAVAGLPSILVPFTGAGGHQRLNADEMAERGMSVVVEDAKIDGASVTDKIVELICNPKKLELMSANCRENSRPDAASSIAKDIAKVMEGRWV